MSDRPPCSRRRFLRSACSTGATAGMLPLHGFPPGSFGLTDREPSVRWTAALSDGVVAPGVTTESAVYVGAMGEFAALDRRTGEPHWVRYRENSLVVGTAVRGDTVFAIDWAGDEFLALDRADGTTRWARESSSPAFRHRDLLYLAGDGIEALRPADGSTLWSFDTRGNPGPLLAHGDTVFAGTDDGTLHAVGASGGEERWSVTLDAPGERVVDTVGVVPAPGESDGADDGGATAHSDPILIAWSPRPSGRVLAFSARDGSRRWSREIDWSSALFPGAVHDGGVVLLDGERIVSLSAADGSVRWQRSAVDGRTQLPIVRTVDEAVFLRAASSVTALSLATGEHRWTFAPEGVERPIVTDVSGGAVTVTATQRRPAAIFRLDGETGRVRWQFSSEDGFSGLATVDDSSVFVATDGGDLVALSDPGRPPARALHDLATERGGPLLGAGAVVGAALLGGASLLAADEGSPGVAGRSLVEFDLRERVDATGHVERFRATHPDCENPVAVLRLRPDARTDPDLVAAFESGVEATAGLSRDGNPVADGLPAVLGRGTAPDPWLATDVPPDDSLADRLDDFDWRDALDVVSRASSVVRAAHEHGVAHTRLAPGSIRLAADADPESVVVTGWERRALPPGDRPAARGYAAPEQVTDGDFRESSIPEATDVYRLGAVAYRAVTGRLPFGDDPTPSDFEGGPTPPTAVDSGLPAELDRRLGRALARRPGERFASAKALGDALRYGVPRD